MILGNRHGDSVSSYRHGNCQCCIMIGTNVEEVNGLHIKPSLEIVRLLIPSIWYNLYLYKGVVTHRKNMLSYKQFLFALRMVYI